MTEGDYQNKLCEKIRERIPGALIMKTDPTFIQGIPDLLIVKDKRWAALEVKKGKKASHRPNQDFYVNKMNNWSYAAVIFPENEKEIIDELERTFTT